MNAAHDVDLPCYTYHATWSAEDGEWVASCSEFPSLPWRATTLDAALVGIRQAVADVVADMRANGERVPETRGDD
jgi:predicted RNase H-like HicB family nuclease